MGGNKNRVLMVPRSNDEFIKEMNPFPERRIPRTGALFVMLLVMSIIIGMAAVTLMNYRFINGRLPYIMVNGALTGVLVIMFPTLLTIVTIKTLNRYINSRYIFFLSIVGTLIYSVFMLLGSIVYVAINAYVIASVIILVGDASIFGWWFFVSKVLMGQRKTSVIFALVQPTLNILLYIPYSTAIFSFNTPLWILVLKLYAGISIFMLVSYIILYLLDRPTKSNLGFRGIDAVSQMVRNWLFDINVSAPFGAKFGTQQDVRTNTIVFRGKKRGIKAIFFAPEIHYGPSGTLCGSDFPYTLERYAKIKYHAPTFVMHRAVNIDSNPVSVSQFGALRSALDQGVKNAREAPKAKRRFYFDIGRYRSARVMALGLGAINMVTMTRAPRITEDVEPAAAILFEELLKGSIGESVIIDAHNSRYESAPDEEKAGVTFNSRFAKEYIEAIKRINASKRATTMRFGARGVELFYRTGSPVDLARGDLNAAVFQIGSTRCGIVQFNANNITPALREQIVTHVKRKYGISVEVYTTDTHAVNSLGFDFENVLGRHMKYKRLEKALDSAVGGAISRMEPVSVSHAAVPMRKFVVWGADAMERIVMVTNSVYDLARILVPVIIAAGFVFAAWAILIA